METVNILLVDDLPEKLLALETVLEGPGINVVRARSGAEALRKLLEQDFAVILLDVNMPGMDGFETAAMIRQHRRCANTPIVFVTAYADDVLTSHGYSLGAVDYILSPVVPQVLRTKVGVFVDLFRKTEEIKRLAEERVALAKEQAARAAAEEANRRKDQFLAMLSHELRNPLAPIINALHLLGQAGLGQAESNEALDVLRRQVQILVRIVDDLLDVFRISHNRLELRRQPLDLAQLVRQTVEDHRGSIERSLRNLHAQTPQGQVWVSADRSRMSQILSNLLHNSRKFTNPGDQIVVTLTADPDKRYSEVSVRDTGIGIPSETLPHVFDIFAQAEQEIDRTRGGLGLGLSLVKGLIELQGGKVKAYSNGAGTGTEIRFRLPLCEKPEDSDTRPDLSVPARQRLRILIVEDNADTARTLKTLLTRYGHDVRCARSGRAGVEAAREWLPQVILCDIGLPEMDGYQVAEALRRAPETAEVRLIAVSGYGQVEDRRRSEAAGFDLHLTKPVDPAQLQHLLAEFVPQR